MDEWFPSTTAVVQQRILDSDAVVVSVGASGYNGALDLVAHHPRIAASRRTGIATTL